MTDFFASISLAMESMSHSIAHFYDLYSVQFIAAMQATFCGGCAWQIGFKYRRGDSEYQWIPSLCAFGLASLAAQQWLSIVGRVLMYGNWPIVSVHNTLFFAIIFILLVRSKGNVSRMFDSERKGYT